MSNSQSNISSAEILAIQTHNTTRRELVTEVGGMKTMCLRLNGGVLAKILGEEWQTKINPYIVQQTPSLIPGGTRFFLNEHALEQVMHQKQRQQEKNKENEALRPVVLELMKHGAEATYTVSSEWLKGRDIRIGWLNTTFADGCNSRSPEITFDMKKLRAFAQERGLLDR